MRQILRTLRRHRWPLLILCLDLFLLLLLGSAVVYKAFWIDEELFVAVDAGDIQKVKELLKKGANPNIEWEDGSTPLQDAKRRGNPEIIRLLQEAGAKE